MDKTELLQELVTEFWELWEDMESLKEQLPKMEGFPLNQMSLRRQLTDVDVSIGKTLQAMYDIVKH